MLQIAFVIQAVTAAVTAEQRLLDAHARQSIRRELGHERLTVMAVYLGT